MKNRVRIPRLVFSCFIVIFCLLIIVTSVFTNTTNQKYAMQITPGTKKFPVFERASVLSAFAGKLRNGDIVEILEKKESWIQIRLSSGQIGWIKYAPSGEDFDNPKGYVPWKWEMQPVAEDAFDHNSGQLMTDLTDSTVLIKARVEYSDLEVYGELGKSDIFQYPTGPVTGVLKIGEIVEILDIYPTDYESGPAFKVRMRSGNIGYVKRGYFQYLEAKNDRGAMIKILLERPYEYECDIAAIDEQILKFRNFISQYPQSQYKLEALDHILSLHEYCFQCNLTAKQAISRLNEIKEIYKILLKYIIKQEFGSHIDLICDETMTEYEKIISITGNAAEFNSERLKCTVLNRIMNDSIPRSRK